MKNITFNADEIFEMAEEVERIAGEFYREAAQKTKDENIRDLLVNMSKMEDEHRSIFHDMRKHLTEHEKAETVYDPEDQAMQYLQTMADAHGYEGKINPGEKLSGKESPREILKIAIVAEKNSIVFYSGLKSLVPKEAGRDKIEKIIHEELGHLATLNRELSKL
ncbi:MAG: ferritin family protein [Phycisphaerae bacterium]|nr:ferritin family protein [Phycisphaerae bacterium]